MARRRFLVEEGSGEGGGEPFLEGLTDDEKSLEEIQTLLKAVPGSGEFYLKVYKTKPLPPGSRPQFKGEITEINLVDDLEIYLRNLAKENGWGAGEYVISVIPKSKKIKPPAPVKLNISYDEEKTTPDPADVFKNKVSELREFLTTFKDLAAPSQGRGIDPGEISKALSESFKMGMETLTGFIPKVQEDDKLLKTITQLKDLELLGGRKQESGSSQVDIVLATLKIIKEMGILDKPKEEKRADPPDFVTQLKQMKELGLIRLAGEEKKEEDIFGTVEKLKTLIELVRPLAGIGGEGEKPTLGVELARILGPHVPHMVDRIASTVDNVAEVSKLRLSGQMGAAPPHTPPKAPILPAHLEGLEGMNPTVREIYEAIKAKNVNFYPRLQELLHVYIGPHTIPGLLSGEIVLENFLTSLSITLSQPFIVEAEAKEYFVNFLNAFTPPASVHLVNKGNSGGVMGRCEKCKEVYDYTDEKTFLEDDHQCDCGGTIHREEVVPSLAVPAEVP